VTSKLVVCDRHGQGPCYVVCVHVVDGKAIAYFDPATEQHIGQAVCEECSLGGDSLHTDLAKCLCAGCMAELLAKRVVNN
jgi:hypothetical protein